MRFRWPRKKTLVRLGGGFILAAAILFFLVRQFGPFDESRLDELPESSVLLDQKGKILFATVGMMTLASAGSLITLFVGLETMSVCLYVLTGLVREEKGANESALKYFLLGAFSTASG